MPITALALVLCAALLHAVWNLGAKKAGGNHHFVLASAIGVSLLWGPAALYLGWRQIPQWPPTAWVCALASAAIHMLYFSCLLKGYRVSDLNVVYPVARGSGPLVSSLAAVLVFGERLGLAGLAGLTAIVGGIVLIAGGPALFFRAGGDAAAREKRRLGVLWGGLTGLLIASYTLVDGYAVKVLLVSPLLIDWVGNVLRVPFSLPAVLRDRAGFMPALRRQWPYVLLMAVCSPAAYILVLYAMQLAPVSRVAPMRELSMLVAALLGGQLLQEGERHWRLLGAAFIAAGVIALAL
ncbi:DMT family transporter [Roseateles violae]|uniref:Guanidinium exporter n=1 Tax=Roseateles violae TaxID=3058042 RepID=A0ABT8DZN3_9BURK|nr:DMT family transporter [Pelomonas sp. PFR6]MDN3923057.1 DMT family transporter [Pelomonas sp. PFR6]